MQRIVRQLDNYSTQHSIRLMPAGFFLALHVREYLHRSHLESCSKIDGQYSIVGESSLKNTSTISRPMQQVVAIACEISTETR